MCRRPKSRNSLIVNKLTPSISVTSAKFNSRSTGFLEIRTNKIDQLQELLYPDEPITRSVTKCVYLQMARLPCTFITRLATLTRGSILWPLQILSTKTSSFTIPLLRRTMAYSICKSGAPNSFDFRIYFRK